MKPVIKTFKCAETEALAKGSPVRRVANIATVARRKLRQLEVAGQLNDLRVPPGHRLEALKGNRVGQHSIPVFVKLVVASPYAPPSACLVSAMAGVSGFNQTVPTGVQLRVWRDQRAGC